MKRYLGFLILIFLGCICLCLAFPELDEWRRLALMFGILFLAWANNVHDGVKTRYDE